MSGRKALQTIWSMKWLAIAILLVVLGVSAGVTTLLPMVYQATATVRVIPYEQNADAFSQLQTNQALARTYTELLKSSNVYRTVVDQEELPLSAEELMEATTVSYVEGTELIQVQLEAQDPGNARSWANAIAQTFVDEQETEDGARLVVADPASTPLEPVSPSLPLNMALALILGTGMAVGGVLLLDLLSDRVSSAEEIVEITEAPVLGSLPTIVPDKKKDKHRSLVAYEEATRTLRVNLNFVLGNSSDNKTILFTSALPGEGKTTVSSDLAIAYTQVGRRSLLVDADLRKPQVHRRFSTRNLQGFSDLLLKGPEALHSLLIEIKENPGLTVLTSGPIPPNPADLLSMGNTEKLIRNMKEEFDLVILDTPPARALADASILGNLTDGVILVVNAQDARRRSLLRTVEQLRSSKVHILGVVLNHVQETASYSYYHYG